MSSLNKLRQRAVVALQPDIEAIDPNDLEKLSHALVQVIEKRPLIQRGINARGHPVGYTVDSFAADQSVIVECSTEASTFTPDFSKLRGDIDHAHKSNPACERLYLFSSMRCPESQGAAVAKMIRAEAFGHCVVDWYDSRRIAEAIFDEVIVNDNRREFFEDLLPELRRLFAEYVFSNAAPPLPDDYVDDPMRAHAISQALLDHRAVNVFDLSGAGKTYATIGYATEHDEDFSAVFWLRGEELHKSTDLRAVHLQRSGVAMNIAALLRNTPCLVVIDNYPLDGPRLGSLLPADMHVGARVLTTALHPLGNSVHDLELPELSNPAARAIISSGKRPPTKPQADEIITFTGGHALILAILRDTVDEFSASWEAIIADIRDNLALYESRNHQTILDRILTKHSAGIVDELLILKWLATPLLDTQFAEHVIGIAGLAKLRRRSILRPLGLGLLKLHDLILECLKHFSLAGSAASDPKSGFWRFFETTWEASPPHFQRSLYLHRQRIAAEVDQNAPAPGLPSYLALLLEDCPLSAPGIAALASQNMRAHLTDRASLGSIIEAIERCIRRSEDDSERERLLHAAVQRLTDALAETTDATLRADLLHHRGKFRHWLGQRPEAAVDYQAVLDLFPNRWAALMQMARVAPKQKAETYLRRIIDAYDRTPADVPSTIILAALTQLGNPENSALRAELINTRVKLIQAAISNSLVTGYSQPYRMLGRLGRHLAFPHPSVLLQIAGAVTFPPAEHAKPGEVFDIAECLKCIGKAHREETGDAAHLPWCRQAIPYYERLQTFNHFQLIMYAECLNLLQDFAAANEVLEQVLSSKREAHWWHRKAQSLLGLGRTEEALDAITHSLEDPQSAAFHGTFFQTRAKIQAARKDASCIDSARSALGIVKLEKHRLQIGAELKIYEAQFAFDVTAKPKPEADSDKSNDRDDPPER